MRTIGRMAAELLGVLLAGVLSDQIGPRGAVLAMASLGLAATLALVTALRRR